jgi:hypothetical protein
VFQKGKSDLFTSEFQKDKGQINWALQSRLNMQPLPIGGIQCSPTVMGMCSEVQFSVEKRSEST